ncbi:MAG: tetratricopeptide repeat protein, partial [Vicinamibacteria bacterium]|nr:tetratricopeptide repeat protein [Vicinamibacteria bacterium]
AEARGHYEALLPLLPKPLTVTIHEQLARCHSNAGEYAEALEHFQVLLDRNPQNMPLRALMATEALKGGLIERGQALLRSVDEARVTDPRVYFEVGLLFVNHGDVGTAEHYFGRALELDPAFVDAWFQRGFARLQLQRWADARTDFERVVALARADTLQASTAKKALASLP